MRRPYVKLSRSWVTEDGYPVRAAMMVTADPPGATRHWSNLRDFRRTLRRVYRELRGVRS